MKKVKEELRELIFEYLVLLVFKFSKSHKLIKFERTENGNKLNYNFTITSTIEENKVKLEKQISGYLKNEVNR